MKDSTDVLSNIKESVISEILEYLFYCTLNHTKFAIIHRDLFQINFR